MLPYLLLHHLLPAFKTKGTACGYEQSLAVWALTTRAHTVTRQLVALALPELDLHYVPEFWSLSMLWFAGMKAIIAEWSGLGLGGLVGSPTESL